MLPLALATFPAPFILHISVVFLTINVVIDVGISVGIDIYVTTTPIGTPPRITPRSTRSKAHPKANHRTRNGREEREGREKRPPPASVDHRRVITRDIDRLWL
jgi:hypothetical protein